MELALFFAIHFHFRAMITGLFGGLLAISAAQAVTWLIDIVENFDNDLINVDNFFF